MNAHVVEPAKSPFPVRTVVGWCGIVLHLLVGLPYLASGLVVPPPYLFGVWLLWFAFLGLAVWLLRHRPVLVPLVPVAALATWQGVLILGSQVLHWTA